METASVAVASVPLRTTFIDAPTRSIANISELPDGSGFDLNRISVLAPHRGQGIGRRLIKEVLDTADAHRLTLWLDINPYGEMTHDELAAWYARCGFVQYEGRWRRLPRT